MGADLTIDEERTTLHIAAGPAPEAAGRGAAARLRHWRKRYGEAGLSVILALQVAIMFVVGPLAGTGVISVEATAVLRVGLAATAILVVSRSRLVGGLMAASFTVSLLCTSLLRTGVASRATLFADIGVTIAFDMAVAWTVAYAVFGPGRITVHRIMGAVILYLYVGLIFAALFHVAALTLHPSFKGLPATSEATFAALLYFSMSTLTTSGFGDIVPVHPFVRALANLESVAGQLYPATLVARLVTLHVTRGEKAAADPGSDEGGSST
jgi:hypothetical protein